MASHTSCPGEVKRNVIRTGRKQEGVSQAERDLTVNSSEPTLPWQRRSREGSRTGSRVSSGHLEISP